MRQFVGKYQLGLRTVRLYVDTNSASGSVDILPEDSGPSIVEIGIANGFDEAVSTLLHEVYEAVLIDLNVRYKQSPSFSGESSNYSFFMSHNELGEAHERIGIFLNKTYPAFAKVYEKLQRKMHCCNK